MREKELSHYTRWSRLHLLFFIGRPDLESVWGSGEGGSSIFVITNPSPSPIPLCSPPRVSNSFVDSLFSEEFDEIHHVIELVLLGLDP